MSKNRSINIIKKIWFTQSKKRKKQTLIVIFLMFISSLCEVFSIATLIPFLSLLTDPEKLLKNDLITNLIIYNDSLRNYIPYLIVCLFISLTIISALIRIFTIKINYKLSAIIGNELNNSLFNSIIKNQNYSKIMNLNISNVISSSTLDILRTIDLIGFVLQIIISSFITISIIVFLIYLNPKLTILLILILLISYFLIGKFIRKILVKNSKIMTISNANLIETINDSINLIKEVRLISAENYFLKNHDKFDKSFRLLGAQNKFVKGLSRFLIEPISIIFLSLISIIIFRFGENNTNLIPLLGVIALSYQKVLPATQQIFNCWSQIKEYTIYAENVFYYIDLSPGKFLYKSKIIQKQAEIEELNFRNISFKQNSKSQPIFENLTFNVKKGEILGVVGKTGSGKSTLLNTIMGFYPLSNGRIEINKNKLKITEIFNNILWQNYISIVPQKIYILNKSIAENIALGKNLDEIDMNRIKSASKLACIDKFINHLPNKYLNNTGQDGALISGGQAQRIGIARALYSSPKILILDEATNALDMKTENNVLKNLKELSYKGLIIIMTIHSENCLQYCDKILDLNKTFYKK